MNKRIQFSDRVLSYTCKPSHHHSLSVICNCDDPLPYECATVVILAVVWGLGKMIQTFSTTQLHNIIIDSYDEGSNQVFLTVHNL